LVVAIVTLVATGLVYRERLSIRTAANQLYTLQAWQYALGGEQLAASLLTQDWQTRDQKEPVDNLAEAWAQPMPAFEVDGGSIQIQIEDLGGRFNLNSVQAAAAPATPETADGSDNSTQTSSDASTTTSTDNANGAAASQSSGLEQFRRLLTELELNPLYADRLRDWIDQDQDLSNAESAEDNQYLLLKPAYRAANQPLVDTSELRLLGMSAAEYQRLAPYVTALPSDATLNVNTASAEVLASLSPTLDMALAQQLVTARGKEGYSNVQDFLALPQLAAAGLQAQSLSVQSRYFRVLTRVKLADRVLLLSSVIQRDKDGHLQVLSRDLGQDPALAAVQDPTEAGRATAEGASPNVPNSDY
jgi:general secretion pathway protein K